MFYMSTLVPSSSILLVVSRVLGTLREAPRDLFIFLLILGSKSLVALGTDLEFLVCEIVEADLHEGWVVFVRCEIVRRSWTSFLCWFLMWIRLLLWLITLTGSLAFKSIDFYLVCLGTFGFFSMTLADAYFLSWFWVTLWIRGYGYLVKDCFSVATIDYLLFLNTMVEKLDVWLVILFLWTTGFF